MLCKGSVAVMPVLLLGIIWYMRPPAIRDYALTAPFFIVAAALTVVNIWFQKHGADYAVRNADLLRRIWALAVQFGFIYTRPCCP